jgi:hypothetical protein
VAESVALSASEGRRVCHSIDESAGVGPTGKGLAGSRVRLSTGETLTATGAYLLTSIEDPDRQVVAGCARGDARLDSARFDLGPQRRRCLHQVVAMMRPAGAVDLCEPGGAARGAVHQARSELLRIACRPGLLCGRLCENAGR